VIGNIRQLLKARPFVPFTIVTSGGNHYPVPTPDHADINPRGTQVVVWFDDDSSVTVPALHIAALEKAAAQET
jgi:hypothetical protein